MTSWESFQSNLFHNEEVGLWIDGSFMGMQSEYRNRHAQAMENALLAMLELENGAIANTDEGRMVGHYWLRAPERAPTHEITTAIEATIEKISAFTAAVHSGAIRPTPDTTFKSFLLIGIGGSALGPQFISDALEQSSDPLTPHFLDNTDPDGIDKLLSRIDLHRCLVIVISKSGSTKETRNGMLEVQNAFAAHNLTFAHHAVAITGDGSALDKTALAEGWLERFPMWDWVGGRTSVTSAVGLLPAALQGIAIRPMLAGAATMDRITRLPTMADNPAALMALLWHHGCHGRGDKDMVMLPYKDRLLLFSRYLQQLIMESLGKELDRNGVSVHQGLTVYGNKGSTDQHAYVQQLRDGVDNFFVTFIEVLKDRDQRSMEVEPHTTSGDYLFGFLYGTREALNERGRRSMTITIKEISPFSIGALIALFERTVGLYAEILNINAYHQPGVEAGKLAAGEILQLQQAVRQWCSKHPGCNPDPAVLAKDLQAPGKEPLIFAILRRDAP